MPPEDIRLNARLYTVGHSTRPVAELVGLLQGQSVGLLVDVRRFPRSRRHPQFDIETLPTSLASAGLDYRHLEALGGRRARSLSDDASPNTGWEAEGFRSYADYALTIPFRDALAALIGFARTRTTAIMCAEALWWQCHRRIITDYLLVRDISVIHILGTGETAPATMTPNARPQPDGSIHYPPAQPRLL